MAERMEDGTADPPGRLGSRPELDPVPPRPRMTEPVSDDRAIEVMAEALWDSFIDHVPWSRAGISVAAAYRERARMGFEALASAGLQITDQNDPDLQLAKSEVHAIATAGVEDEEIIADFQDMARNAHQALTRYVTRLSGASGG